MSTQIEQNAVSAIRVLSADMIQKANSGHPGLPLGAASVAYTLWGKEMNFDPKDPKWINRDRFVLSGGHGSALYYSLLHLFGVGGLSIEDLKQFRQMDSKTPGHPEYGHTAGIDATTGPLGAGLSMAVGMAVAEAHLAETFNKPNFNVIDHYTYVMCGDGCLMEGISEEALSLSADDLDSILEKEAEEKKGKKGLLAKILDFFTETDEDEEGTSSEIKLSEENATVLEELDADKLEQVYDFVKSIAS